MTEYGTVRAPDFPEGLTWINTPRPLSLRQDLRGKFVLLDFWTAGCINCHHVLPDIERIEHAYTDVLVVIGVHAAKFPNEREDEAVAHAVRRHGLAHPVVNDPDLVVWEHYGVKAWPTLFLIDPRGYIVGYVSGEGAYEPMARALEQLVPRFAAEDALDRAPLDLSSGEAADAFPEPSGPARASGLTYPGAVVVDSAAERIFIADTGRHRILVVGFDGRVQVQIGSGRPGLADGRIEEAEFRQPHGMHLDAPRNTLYVADTANHALRSVTLGTGHVRTLAGNGAQARPDARFADGRGSPLNSPWDVLLHDGRLYVAMAGAHQIWVFDSRTGEGGVYAGDGGEALVDAPRPEARLAQPSALATDGEALYIADSEASAVRRLRFGSTLEPVETLVGEGLFVFGDRDGTRESARLQHPLGLAYADGVLYVADTYNHKIKRLFVETGTVVGFLGAGTPGHADGALMGAQFDEPAGLAVADGRLYVADTNNHRIRIVDLDAGDVETLAVRAPVPSAVVRAHAATQRVKPGPGRIEIAFELPAGYVLNPIDAGRLALRTDAGEFGSATIRTPADEAAWIALYQFEHDEDLLLDGRVYFCEEDGLCLVHPVALRIPVVVDPEVESRSVELLVEVPR